MCKNKIKLLRKSMAIFAVIFVLATSFCISASADDAINTNGYYTPNGNTLTSFDNYAEGALTHMYADYYLDVVYYIDDVQYHYTTVADFAENISEPDNGYVNFGDTDADIVQFWVDHWRIRHSGGTVTDIEYTDVFIKPIAVEDADISLLEGWFDENFTIYFEPTDYKGLLGEFVDLIVGGISGIADGIGSGVNNFVQSLFLRSEAGSITGLSTFGFTVAIFGGVSLACGLTALLFSWIKSIGN